MHPASPQENGSHERMHRDLKAEAIKPPSANLAAQQRRFGRSQHTCSPCGWCEWCELNLVRLI